MTTHHVGLISCNTLGLARRSLEEVHQHRTGSIVFNNDAIDSDPLAGATPLHAGY